MSGHTPDEWKIRYENNTNDIRFREWWQVGPVQVPICGDPAKEELLARSIQAFPLMLEALKRVAEVYELMRAELIANNDPYANDISQVERDIRAAIRAAEGGE